MLGLHFAGRVFSPTGASCGPWRTDGGCEPSFAIVVRLFSPFLLAIEMDGVVVVFRCCCFEVDTWNLGARLLLFVEYNEHGEYTEVDNNV